MLLPIPKLANRGFDVNARGCRKPSEGLKVLQGIKDAGQLPHLVVVYLGVDGKMTAGKIRKFKAILGHGRVLVLVTGIHGPTQGRLPGTIPIKKAGRKDHKHVIVMDWWRHSRHHTDWFLPDNYHPSFKGADAFAKFIARVIPFSKEGVMPSKHHHPKEHYVAKG